MLTGCLLAVLWASSAALLAPPRPYPPPFPPPRPSVPTPQEPPHKQFPGSVCPPDSKCVQPENCISQCRLPWTSLHTDSCYLYRTGTADFSTSSGAAAICGAAGGHLLVLERRPEVEALVAADVTAWTDGKYDRERHAWVWQSTGQEVDFNALGLTAPQLIDNVDNCLAFGSAGTATFLAIPCTEQFPFACETGSSSVAQCMKQKNRVCCAFDSQFLPEPCYVDERGTRCEQRVREGYVPFRGGLLRAAVVPRGALVTFDAARADCLQDGADLMVFHSAEMESAIHDMLSDNVAFGVSSWLLGIRSGETGSYFYPNGTLLSPAAYTNWDSAGPGGAGVKCVVSDSVRRWRHTPPDASGVCGIRAPGGYICHIPQLRHSLIQPEASVAGKCGRRQSRGVLAKSGGFALPPPPPFLPPLGPHDDGRRGASQFGEFPWQAAVWTRTSDSDHTFSCSGALVHNSWVLTSTHCVSGVDAEDLKVTVGEWTLDQSQPVNLPPVALDVERVEISPDRLTTGPYGPSLERGRLALLKITPDLTGSGYPHVAPVCLPEPRLLPLLPHLKCVVTGWRGGTVPVPAPFPLAGPEPDERDILRKFETPVRRDEQCQDLAQRLHIISRPPPVYPPYPYPGYTYDPYRAYGRSAAGASEEAEARSGGYGGFSGPLHGGLSFFPPPLHHRQRQRDVFVCPRDLRCIPDGGALLACAVPPPPPPPPVLPFPLPPPHPLYRAANGSAEDTSDAAATTEGSAATPAPASTKKEEKKDVKEEKKDVKKEEKDAKKEQKDAKKQEESIVDAFERLSHGFRPPVVVGTDTRKRRDTEAAASADEEAKAAKTGFNLPHNTLGSFHGLPPPPPLAILPPNPHIPTHPQPQPPGHPEQLHDEYTIIGIASKLTTKCAHGQMLFNDIIQELEFIQEFLHQDG